VGARHALGRLSLARLVSSARDRDSAFESEIAPSVALDLSMTRELECSLAPALDVAAELLVAGVVESELLSAKTTGPGEHLGEDRGSEAAILLSCEPAEPVESVAGLDLHQVDKVAGFSTPEEGEKLVDRELLTREHRSGLTGLGRKEPRVRSQVHLGAIVGAFDDQSREARIHLDVVDDETGVPECSIDSRDEPVDRIGRQAEEVKVACLSLNVSAGDQRSAAGKGEAISLLEARDDLGNLLLERVSTYAASR